MYALIGLLMLVGSVYMMLSGEMLGIIIGISLLAMGAANIWIVFSHYKRKYNDLKSQNQIIFARQRDYDASKERLKDTNYLASLAKHDSLAARLLKERRGGQIEHYAERPEMHKF